MDEKGQTVVTFKLPLDEVQLLDAKAAKEGMNRSDYLRMLILNPPLTRIDDLEMLLRHIIFMVNQTHNAVYSIAEMEGKAKRFPTTDELAGIYNRIEAETVFYSLDLPQHLGIVRAKQIEAEKIRAAAQKKEN